MELKAKRSSSSVTATAFPGKPSSFVLKRRALKLFMRQPNASSEQAQAQWTWKTKSGLKI